MAITRIGNITNTLPDNSISNAKLTDIVNFKNIIINGDMSIAQRGTSESGITSNGYYTCDRWQTIIVGGTYTQAQTALTSSDTPFSNGFSNSIKYDCTSTYTSADSLVLLRQKIEGQYLQYLGYGTSSAKSLTLSFWVKSNVTGTATASLYDNDNAKHQGKTYTINSANTWEKKTLTFSGNTSNSFDNNNSVSLYVSLIFSAGTNYTSGTLPSTWTSYTDADLAVGQTIDISANTANEISFTGIQLEAGTTASDFEFLPYDVNLQRCQRYFQVLYYAHSAPIMMGNSYNTTAAYGPIDFNPMRAAPTVTLPSSGQTANTISFLVANGGYPSTTGTHSAGQISINNFQILGTGYVNLSNQSISALYSNQTNEITLNAEL